MEKKHIKCTASPYKLQAMGNRNENPQWLRSDAERFFLGVIANHHNSLNDWQWNLIKIISWIPHVVGVLMNGNLVYMCIESYFFLINFHRDQHFGDTIITSSVYKYFHLMNGRPVNICCWVHSTKVSLKSCQITSHSHSFMASENSNNLKWERMSRKLLHTDSGHTNYTRTWVQRNCIIT